MFCKHFHFILKMLSSPHTTLGWKDTSILAPKKKKKEKSEKSHLFKNCPKKKKKQKNPVDIFLLSTDGSAALSWTDIIVNLSQGCSLYQPVS